jgi:ATP-dependent DNA ligase
VNDGKVQAFTRNGNDWTARYPAIVAAAEKLRCRSAVIDGEVIVQDESGQRFVRCRNRRIPERRMLALCRWVDGSKDAGKGGRCLGTSS